MSARGPARGASGLRGSGSGAAGGEDDGERRQSVRLCVPPLTIGIGGDAMVVEKTGDAMACEKTGAWTGKKKAKVQSAPMSEGVDMTAPVISTEPGPEQGVEGFDWKQVEGFDWTYADVKEEVDSFQKYRGLPNLDDDFWILNDDQQTEELRKRLAICHIRAHKGAGLNDAQLLSILEQDGPFRPYEHPPKWMFDVERFKISGFQDYQRLIPVESYVCNTYFSDPFLLLSPRHRIFFSSRCILFGATLNSLFCSGSSIFAQGFEMEWCLVYVALFKGCRRKLSPCQCRIHRANAVGVGHLEINHTQQL